MAKDPESDLDTYASLVVALSKEGADPAAILAPFGLDEAQWNDIDDQWQAKLSDAATQADEDHVPEVVVAYAKAFERAQEAHRSEEVLTIDQYAEITLLLRQHGDVQKAVKAVGATVSQYVDASQHWARRIVQDADLAAKFTKLMRG